MSDNLLFIFMSHCTLNLTLRRMKNLSFFKKMFSLAELFWFYSHCHCVIKIQ